MRNLLIILLIGYALLLNQPQLSIPIPTKIPVVTQNVVDEAAVIKSVRSISQLAGMEGNISKTYTYSDALYQTNTIADQLGYRQFSVTIDCRFKIGIDADKIQIYCKGNDVAIMLPEPVLISLEMNKPPKFNNDKTGLLRTQLLDDDKTMLLFKAQESASIECMTKDNKEKSSQSIKATLKNLLSKVNGVNKIEFF